MSGEYWDEEMARQITSQSYWNGLQYLQNLKHTIGYHTVNHVRIDTRIQQIGFVEFRKQEIDTGLKLFAEQGLKARHIAYPYGYQTEIIDNFLLQYFDTVRDSILPDESQKMRYYSVDEVQNMRSFVAYDFQRSDLFKVAEEGFKQGKIGFYHGHNPFSFQDKIMKLINIANRYNAQYYSMGVLDRE